MWLCQFWMCGQTVLCSYLFQYSLAYFLVQGLLSDLGIEYGYGGMRMGLNMTRDLEHLDHRNGEKSLSCVWLFATPWTGAHQALLPWDFPCKNTGVGCHFLLQEIYPTQGLNLGLLHSRLYHFTVWATREVWSWKAVIIPKRKRVLLSEEWGVDAGQLERKYLLFLEDDPWFQHWIQHLLRSQLPNNLWSDFPCRVCWDCICSTEEWHPKKEHS